MDTSPNVDVRRHEAALTPDVQRVIVRPHAPGGGYRAQHIFRRIAALPEDEVERLLADVRRRFSARHDNLDALLHMCFTQVERWAPGGGDGTAWTHARTLLAGAYFAKEYTPEAAALFNPSIVPHPDQSGVPEGGLRFVMSLRATGEGHISSLTFVEGMVTPDGDVRLAERHPYTQEGQTTPAPYDPEQFGRALAALDVAQGLASSVVRSLGTAFSFSDVRTEIDDALHARVLPEMPEDKRVAFRDRVMAAAQAYYRVQFADEVPLSGRLLFPYTDDELMGMEDVRFVAFREGGSTRYHGTYTAYDGRHIRSKLISTDDFTTFDVRTLEGAAIQNKGMALFPRKVGGRYAVIGRQDGENLFIMFSDDVHHWAELQLLAEPEAPWEFVQIGNCGSPIETEAGWLLLTHGVGPMRRYCLGAMLLDLDDPTQVLGQLRRPLLGPNEQERDGYVPNVVYTCGALVHKGRLILPYAASDMATLFASCEVDDLIAAIQADSRAD